eukprot:TRINITY_DN34782_c0_g1_i1.p1 TRINITY_DN34782_c0_g1~~TRINITY_DN34782_c0_g1_i1.p1  ORF type:complete len:479 (+),score=60.07 TRINITY_DN34782_c0_g1_i1:33-1439(+)
MPMLLVLAAVAVALVHPIEATVAAALPLCKCRVVQYNTDGCKGVPTTTATEEYIHGLCWGLHGSTVSQFGLQLDSTCNHITSYPTDDCGGRPTGSTNADGSCLNVAMGRSAKYNCSLVPGGSATPPNPNAVCACELKTWPNPKAGCTGNPSETDVKPYLKNVCTAVAFSQGVDAYVMVNNCGGFTYYTDPACTGSAIANFPNNKCEAGATEVLCVPGTTPPPSPPPRPPATPAPLPPAAPASPVCRCSVEEWKNDACLGPPPGDTIVEDYVHGVCWGLEGKLLDNFGLMLANDCSMITSYPVDTCQGTAISSAVTVGEPKCLKIGQGRSAKYHCTRIADNTAPPAATLCTCRLQSYNASKTKNCAASALEETDVNVYVNKRCTALAFGGSQEVYGMTTDCNGFMYYTDPSCTTQMQGFNFPNGQCVLGNLRMTCTSNGGSTPTPSSGNSAVRVAAGTFLLFATALMWL